VANTPLRRHKTWVHEGGISTPLIAHWPKGITARGEYRRTPGHVIDLAPTVLELAGGTWPATYDGHPVPPTPGRSLLPAFAKDGPPLHDWLWWLHEGNRALRVGDLKLVAAGTNASWELYNLHADRSEMTNLAAQLPDQVRVMAQTWTNQWEDIRAMALKDVPPPGRQKTAPQKK
jgi:arylsulfatase